MIRILHPRAGGLLAPHDLAEAVAALRDGAAIVYPTETLYGLGARALDADAVANVVRLKGRPDAKPFPLVVRDRAMVDRIAAVVPARAAALMERYWPGALTLVLRARPGLPAGVVGDDGTVACRVSSAPIAAQLVAALGEPLVATSANRSGEPASSTLEPVLASLGDGVVLAIAGGELPGRIGSTIVDATVNPPRVLRAGDLEVDLTTGSG